MRIYQVGGIVRDTLLNLPVKDRDYVVVGGSKDEMLELGFIQVGRDFPVFLHPKTHEEYALARIDKKISHGHQGFTFDTSKTVSLVDDLKRRDLTINAMAFDDDGTLIDPFNGKTDLENKVLRHVSEAFSEDPLRVFRVARFSAKLNFTVTHETLVLMRQLVMSDELKTLSKERIFNELKRALMTKHIYNFFLVLKKVNALNIIHPGLNNILDNSKLNIELQQILHPLASNNFTLEQRFALIDFYAVYSTIPLPNVHTIKQIQQANIKNIQQSTLNKVTPNSCKNLANLLIYSYYKIYYLHLLSEIDIYNLIKRLDPLRKPNVYSLLLPLVKLIASIKQHNTTVEKNIKTLNIVIKKIRTINYGTFDQIAIRQKGVQIKTLWLKLIKECL